MALVVTVAQQKGGSGKTSLAAHLAVTWANPGEGHGRPLSVIALDLDPQESLLKWFEVRQIAEGAGGEIDVRRGTGWRFSSELLRAKKEADIVVIDLPPGSDNAASGAIRAADLVIVPLQLSPIDLWATEPTIALARQAGVPPILVMNRMPARARLNDTVIEAVQREEWPMARATLGNRVLFAASLMEGRGVTETAPSSLAAAEMRLLAKELISRTKSFARAA